MAYPFAGFGSFLFQRSEGPIYGTDTEWVREPSDAISRPLGSSRDSIVRLAAGSPTRSFECWLTPARLTALAALMGTTATFTDWARPTPDSRSAWLRNVVPVETKAAVCADSTDNTRKRIRIRVELISQG